MAVASTSTDYNNLLSTNTNNNNNNNKEENILSKNGKKKLTKTMANNSSLSTASATSALSSSSSSSKLDFYESMYHFKKMFPKFDSDVIEAVLRSNEGAVDKTIDQLLTMSIETEIIETSNISNINLTIATSPSPSSTTIVAAATESHTTPSSYEYTSTSSSLFSSALTNDLPPSYNEIMSNKMAQVSLVESKTVQLNNNNKTQATNNYDSINEKLENNSVTLIKENNTFNKATTKSYTKLDQSTTSIINSNESTNKIKMSQATAAASADSSSSSKTSSLIEKSRILIGELPKDFLRIKLNGEQVKKLKSCIKKAKRNEITAMLNNKMPDDPPLSFEIRKKLNMLNEPLEPNADDFINDDLEDWKTRYTTITKMYEKRRLQIIQDEYLAKLIQNEEFLNELRTNQDFIQTLNYEANCRVDMLEDEYYDFNGANSKRSSLFDSYSYDNTYNYSSLGNRNVGGESNSKQVSLTNAELKSKLTNMGKASRAKLTKIASSFVNRAKSKCNKALDQTTTTCSNIFTSPFSNSLEYKSNNSYYNNNHNDSSSIDLNNNNNNNNYKTLKEKSTNHKYQIDSSSSSSSNSKSLLKDLNFHDYNSGVADYDDDNVVVAEQTNYSKSTTNPSRYQKAYRSFKSALRRNSSASTTSCTSSTDTKSRKHQDNSKNKLTYGSSINSSEMVVFENEYSYEKCFDDDYNYDYSVYPYTKSLKHSSLSSSSKSSKTILDNYKSNSQNNLK